MVKPRLVLDVRGADGVRSPYPMVVMVAVAK